MHNNYDNRMHNHILLQMSLIDYLGFKRIQGDGQNDQDKYNRD